MQKIPLTSDYAQQQTVVLNGTSYDLFVRWNELRQAWALDIADTASGIPLAYGVPLVLGADVLAGFGLGIGSLFCLDLNSDNLDATSEDLGTRVVLIYAAPGEATIFGA